MRLLGCEYEEIRSGRAQMVGEGWPMTARHFRVICSKSTDLHDHEILVDLCGDGAEQRGELVLTGGDLSVSVVGRSAD